MEQMLVTTSAAEFWSKEARSFLGPLLNLAGTYAASDQVSHLRFFEEHIAPCLGPQPAEPQVEYHASRALAGTRFEVSLNLTTRGKARVRYSFDLMRDGMGPDPFGEEKAREMLHHLCSATGGDARLMNHLMETLFLSPSETAALREKVKPQLHIPPAAIAFELEGPRQFMKVYIPVVRKTALGKPSVEIIMDALRGLEPLGYDLSYNMDLLDRYLTGCQGQVKPMMVGIDCLDPTTHRDSRVKVYVHTESKTFATARDVITLGGRLSDEFTLKKVDLLRSIWHLLLNEPNGGLDDNNGDGIDTWSKKERAPGTVFSGLLFTIDLAAGSGTPDIKTYVPVFQYAESTETVSRNTDAILKTLGHEWGQTGRFGEVTDAVLGGQKAYGQSYVTFTCTESKGVYLTSYFSRPILNREQVPQGQAGKDAYNVMK
ncbi:aromatic prenyltransferase [Annulohypoxylon bovei var. microspora]|nr:aromatic prenyltransferase [Annulohypoxylon bovei var. microspora]